MGQTIDPTHLILGTSTKNKLGRQEQRFETVYQRRIYIYICFNACTLKHQSWQKASFEAEAKRALKLVGSKLLELYTIAESSENGT